jgi:hypothetical protein
MGYSTPSDQASHSRSQLIERASYGAKMCSSNGHEMISIDRQRAMSLHDNFPQAAEQILMRISLVNNQETHSTRIHDLDTPQVDITGKYVEKMH